MRTSPSQSSVVELGTVAKRGLRRRMTCLVQAAQSHRSADVMAYGFGLSVGLSLMAGGIHALSIGADPHGAALLIAVGLGLFGLSSLGLWTVLTTVCRSMPTSTP